jgi:hypothetical protein
MNLPTKEFENFIQLANLSKNERSAIFRATWSLSSSHENIEL